MSSVCLLARSINRTNQTMLERDVSFSAIPESPTTLCWRPTLHSIESSISRVSFYARSTWMMLKQGERASPYSPENLCLVVHTVVINLLYSRVCIEKLFRECFLPPTDKPDRRALSLLCLFENFDSLAAKAFHGLLLTQQR